MDHKSRFAQKYSTSLLPVILRTSLRPSGSAVANSALARQFAARQRQRLVYRFRNYARLRIRLLAAASVRRLRRVFLIVSHSVFPQSELEFATKEAISFLEFVCIADAACSLCSALMGVATPASCAFCSASSHARS